jgi:hypothetical protein
MHQMCRRSVSAKIYRTKDNLHEPMSMAEVTSAASIGLTHLSEQKICGLLSAAADRTAHGIRSGRKAPHVRDKNNLDPQCGILL